MIELVLSAKDARHDPAGHDISAISGRYQGDIAREIVTFCIENREIRIVLTLYVDFGA